MQRAALAVALAACGYPRPARVSSDAPDVDAAAIGDSAVAQPRCASLEPICGPVGMSDCCASSTIPGGTFLRGYDVGTDNANNKTATNPATISTFVFDDYLVTVGRFRAFVTAGMGTQDHPPAAGAGEHPNLASSGWNASWNTSLAADTGALIAGLNCSAADQTWTDAAGSNEALPINCATWFEAMAFCIWDGGYLPTDAEGNYAAVGGSEQRAFPWSNPPGSLTMGCTYANFAPGARCVGQLNRVGSEPMGGGKWQQSDLAGEGFEWGLDWETSPTSYPNPCNDCANLVPATNRVTRGGGFEDSALHLRGGNRISDPPAIRDIDIAFRCARSQ